MKYGLNVLMIRNFVSTAYLGEQFPEPEFPSTVKFIVVASLFQFTLERENH